MQKNGFIGRKQYPIGPVQWAVWGTASPVTVTTGKRILFEFQSGGWDDFGLNADTTGLDAGDTVEITVETPAGAIVATQTITGATTAGDQATTSTASIPALSPRLVVKAKGTYAVITSVDVNCQVFLRRLNSC